MDELAALQIELNSLQEQKRAILARIEKVRQNMLAIKAVHKIGDTIEWGSPDKPKRGVVRGFRDWVCGEVTYIVQRLRKDGSDGATVAVYSYDKPRASSNAWSGHSANCSSQEKP